MSLVYSVDYRKKPEALFCYLSDHSTTTTTSPPPDPVETIPAQKRSKPPEWTDRDIDYADWFRTIKTDRRNQCRVQFARVACSFFWRGCLSVCLPALAPLSASPPLRSLRAQWYCVLLAQEVFGVPANAVWLVIAAQ